MNMRNLHKETESAILAWICSQGGKRTEFDLMKSGRQCDYEETQHQRIGKGDGLDLLDSAGGDGFRKF